MTAAAGEAFLLAAGVHAGFQTTVSALVYPTLARVRPAHWREEHDRHSRRITPLVGVVYAGVVATAAWLLVTDRSALGVAAVVATGLALVVTAALAAPIHGRLQHRDDALVDRLLRVDRVRTGLAVVGAALALAAVLVS